MHIHVVEKKRSDSRLEALLKETTDTTSAEGVLNLTHSIVMLGVPLDEFGYKSQERFEDPMYRTRVGKFLSRVPGLAGKVRTYVEQDMSSEEPDLVGDPQFGAALCNWLKTLE